MALESTPVEKLTAAEAEAELQRLAEEIAAHDLAYYQDETPAVSDADYDLLKRRNEAIEARFPKLIREDSPSRKVGAAPSTQFAPVTHGVPMLSLDNAMSDEEVSDFAARVARFLKLGDEAVAFTAEATLLDPT